ncbi:MAG: hypothetical protein AAB442_01835 [Patescibacteria group bacterium]
MLLARQNPYVSGEVALFDTLVRAGEEKASVTLPHALHGFLVDCLVEHLRDPEITHDVLALGFLRAVELSGEKGNVVLKRVGDEALLLAGLFPERALRLRVSVRYFRQMGQSAYGNLSAKLIAGGKPERSHFYNTLARQFELLEKVLGAVRATPESEWDAFRRFRAQLQ